MGILSRLLRIPRPQKFLYTMSLSTGASLITLSLLLNKLSGLYGILALLTGYELSPFQLSMYIYSIFALGLTVYLAPHIKSQTPLHCIALAWFYVLDSIINAAYTAAFAITWFLVLASHQSGSGSNVKAPGAGTIDDTAGFTNPEFNVSKVEVIASPQPGLSGGQDAVAAGVASNSPAGVDANSSLKSTVLSTESMNSIGVIIALWTIRLYFCVVMLAFARAVLRQHIVHMASRNPSTSYANASTDKGLAENPFADSKPEGQGWKGKLGRFMVALGPSYWLGADEDDSWAIALGGKFRRVQGGAGAQAEAGIQGLPLTKLDTGSTNGSISAGNTERERRRRSGTGPPLPEVAAQAAAAQQPAGDGKTLQVPPMPNL